MPKPFAAKKPNSRRIPATAWVWMSACALLACVGCAKIADPRPPRIRVPKPAVDLEVRQFAGSVIITLSMPDQNTDGSPAITLRRVDIFRLAEDASRSRNPAPLPEKEFLLKAELIFSIPESRFPEYAAGKSLLVRDEILSPNKSAAYASTFRYAALFVNNRNQAAGLSNQVAIQPVPIPKPPAALSAEVAEHYITLKWAPPSENMDGSRPPRLAGYNIYRSEDPRQLPSSPINSDPIQTSTYEDSSFHFGKTYSYAVSSVANVKNPHAESEVSDIISIVARDIFPPAPPKNFTAALEEEGEIIVLLWSPSPSPDVQGYRIYRLERGATPRPLHTGLIAGLSYRDSGAAKSSRYSIVAVDANGNESKAIQTRVVFD